MGKKTLCLVTLGVSFWLAACANTEKVATAPVPQVVTAPTPTPTPLAPDVSKESKSASDMLVCKLGSDERQAEIESVNPKGCKVFYSKFGKRMKIASSRIGNKHCIDVKARIKKHLTAAKFECKE